MLLVVMRRVFLPERKLLTSIWLLQRKIVVKLLFFAKGLVSPTQRLRDWCGSLIVDEHLLRPGSLETVLLHQLVYDLPVFLEVLDYHD